MGPSFGGAILTTALVLAGVRGEEIERLGDLNAFENQEFTLHCPEGNFPYFWYNSTDTKDENRIALVLEHIGKADCLGDYANRGCSIDEKTGDLTLDRVTFADERDYVCKKSFTYVRRLNVNVNPTDVHMKPFNDPNPKDGEEFKLNCTVGRIRPSDPKVFFKKFIKDGEDEIIEPERPEVKDLGDGTYALTITKWYRFTREDDRRTLRCVVKPKDGRGSRRTDQQQIFMHWQYTTDVEEANPADQAVEGGEKTLQCVNTDENKGKPREILSVRWIRGGQTLPGNDRYEGANTRTLRIRDLRREDAGSYNCAIMNPAGSGNGRNAFSLDVLYTYKSIVSETDASEVPLLGEEKSLTCHPKEQGNPEETQGARWYHEGRRISESDKYQITNTYNLLIRNLQRTSDNGEYTCTILNKAGEGYSVSGFRLQVFWAPIGQPVVEPVEQTVAVLSEVSLTCSTDSLQDVGSPAVSYTEWTRVSNGFLKRNISGTTLTIANFPSVNDGGYFNCQAGNRIGTTDLSQPGHVKIETPVRIEGYGPKGRQNTVVYNDPNFEVWCLASGSNIDEVTWTKDGALLDDSYFVRDRLQLEQGEYEFQQTEAVKSVLRRNIVEDRFSCDNVQYYSGEYSCEPQGVVAGDPSTGKSPDIIVKTTYPPLWAGQEELLESAARDDELKKIQCLVCADPPVQSYSWKFKSAEDLEGEPLRDDIRPSRDGESITLDRVGSEDFGFYECTATNDVGQKTFLIELTEEGMPYEPKHFEVVSETSASVKVRWQAGFAAGYEPQTFTLEYRLKSDSDFKLFRDNIAEGKGWIHQTIFPLAASSEYVVRVRAFNQRPVSPNHSQYVTVTATTKARPDVRLSHVEVEETRMTVMWKFTSGSDERRRRRRNAVPAGEGEEEYSVGVRVKYKKASDPEYTIYPADGKTTIPASQGRAEINGTFDIYAEYAVIALVCENDLECDTVLGEPFTNDPHPKPKEGSAIGGIIGGVVAVVIILVIVVVVFLLFKRRQHQRRTKGGQKIEMSNQKSANQRSSAGYSPLPRDGERLPFAEQANGEKPYMNLQEVKGHDGYDDPSAPDLLYDTVGEGNGPGPRGDGDRPAAPLPVQRCPAPPPPVEPEPVYAKPDKTGKKKKKQKKEKNAAKPPEVKEESPYANAGPVVENPYQNVTYSGASAQPEGLYDDVALHNTGSEEELINDNNVEGLVYADLDMKRNSANQQPTAPKRKPNKPVVIQNEPNTDYAVIDFSAAPPSPPAEFAPSPGDGATSGPPGQQNGC